MDIKSRMLTQPMHGGEGQESFLEWAHLRVGDNQIKELGGKSWKVCSTL